MKSFDEWYKEAKKSNDDGFSAKDFFKAGQQSKQAEVDELKKRIDVLTGKVNEMAYIFLDDLEEILKGDQS